MIIKSRKQLPLQEPGAEKNLPVLPLRSAIIFPGEIHTIQMGRKENLELLKAVAQRDNLMVLSFSPQSVPVSSSTRLSQVGVLAKVQSVKSAMANSKMVTLEGLRRVALMKMVSTVPFVEARTAEVKEGAEDGMRLEEHLSEITHLVTNLIRLDDRYSHELIYNLEMSRPSPNAFADRIGAMIHFYLADKQELIGAVEITDRLETLIRLLKDEIEKFSLSTQIQTRVTESLERKKRESFLRQQLMEIRRELGEEFIEEDVSKTYQNKIKENRALPAEVASRLSFETDRLAHLSSSSAEYGFTKSYIDLLLSLPWSSPRAEPFDLVEVEKAINKDYYGLSHIKEQVLEYLSMRQLSRDVRDLPILCLAGAVGTGKASLVKSITNAMGRKLVRINGASLLMVEDIKGAHRNDIGAGPGQLVRAIKRAGSLDLVIYLEDLEYVIESEDTNALLALLEAVDPRHNNNFVDSFIGIPLDFSRILFVLGITGEDFPEPFAHRLEMVEMTGYIEREKIVITKKHILPKLYKRYGLTRNELKFTDKGLQKIIREYTMEAGLIGLQQQLEKVFRRITRKKATCETCKYVLKENSVDKLLGTPQFIPEKAMARPEIGVANGLAWTGAGGDLMLIEGLKMRGTGQVITTGSLGEVMKESIQAAHSFVRARADLLGIDHNDFVNFDVHIHFPMGAIPKDGPSAGVTVSLVVASVMAERPIRNDIAMTGEVTLRGRVLPVSGVKEKVSAAYRAGIHTIILPKENKKDIKDIPREIVRKTSFVFIESVDELFEQGLLDFTPSTYTLEKIFAEEIEKAKKRTRAKSRAASGKTKKKTTKKKTTVKRKKKAE
jgi:ATP-dependent Lon protease